MPKNLPENTDQKLVLISEAATILGVSIDTVRRWDKAGILHSSRPDGKNRYFSIAELEQVKFSQPLSITGAAKQLGLSATTLRRLETRGLLKPERARGGGRVYRKETLENFLRSDYFLRQKEVEKRILEPLEEPSQKAVPQAPRIAIKQKILGAMTEENRRRIAILAGVQRFFILILLGGAVSLAVVVAIFTLLFLFYPEQTGQFLGYRKSLSANMNPQVNKVLGVSTGPADPVIQAETVGQFLRPLSDISLAVVKKVDPATYQQIIPQEPIRDVNEVLAISSEGEIVPQLTLALPGSSYLKIPDSVLIDNLNAAFVGGKEAGEEAGDLAVLGEGGAVLGLKSVSGLSSGIVHSNSAGQLSSGTVSLTDDVSGSLSIAYGGTGGTTAATARTALGLVIGTDVPSPKGSGASGTWAIDISGNAGNVSGTVGVGNGGTGKTSWTKYAIPYLSATTTFGEVAIGSAGQVLQINSGATGYQWHTLTASDIGLSGVENTALSTWTGTSSLTTVGTLISGSTGTGFTLDFANSTLSGNVSGANISGLAASDFTSDAISQWTNDSNYITASTTITGLIQSASAGTSYFTGGNVGIGTTNPLGLLNLSSNASVTDLFIDNYGAGQYHYPRLIGRRANGTAASPTAVQASDALFGFNARGYGSTGFSTSSRSFIAFYASQTWTDDNQGSYIGIGTTPDNSTTATEVLRISQSGNVGIGTTAPSAPLEVNGALKATTFNGNTLTAGTGTLTLANSLITSGNYSLTLTTTGTTNVTLPTTGTLATLAGTETLSGKTFSGNTYFPGSGIWGTGGNVGIGTTAPTQALQVIGTGTGTGRGINISDTLAANTNKNAILTGISYTSSTVPVTLVNLFTNSTDNTLYWGGGYGTQQPATVQTFWTKSGVDTANAGTERMRITAAGNIGIGTTSPKIMLQAQKDQDSSTEIGVVNQNAGNSARAAIRLYNDQSNLATGANTAGIYLSSSTYNLAELNPNSVRFVNNISTGDMDFYAGGSTRVIIKSSGNLGIGTTSPLALLDVNGTARTTTLNAVSAIQLNGTSINTGGTLTNVAYLNQANAFTANQNLNTGFDVDDAFSVADGGALTTSQAATFNGNLLFGTSTGILKSNGNVGIGTTAPTQALQVIGSGTGTGRGINISDTLAANTNKNAILTGISYTSSTVPVTLVNLFTNSTDNTLYWGGGYGTQQPATVQTFWTKSGVDTANAGTERMRITSSGNIGVGNTAPETKLVVGNASATGNLTVYGTGTTCTIGDGTSATSCSSDIRLKTNVTTLDSSLDQIMQLNPVTFTWKDPLRSQSTNLGFIAQEVREVYPELVRTMSDGYLGLDYAGFVVPAVKAIQELNHQIASNSSQLQNFHTENKAGVSVQIEELKIWVEEQITASFSAIQELVVHKSLSVLGSARFEGESIFQAAVEFLAGVTFKGPVFFANQPIFGSDTAGLALIKQGSSSVEVRFAQEHAIAPIVTVSLSLPAESSASAILQNNFRYGVGKRSGKGFTIQLSEPAVQDTEFTWAAVIVKDAQLSTSVPEATTAATPAITIQTTSQYLTTDQEATVAGSVIISEATDSARELEVQTTELGYLRVRADHSATAAEIGQVLPGEKFTIIEQTSGWYKIEYASGEFGWVSGSYVTVN